MKQVSVWPYIFFLIGIVVAGIVYLCRYASDSHLPPERFPPPRPDPELVEEEIAQLEVEVERLRGIVQGLTAVAESK